jgi:hypothetical protein
MGVHSAAVSEQLPCLSKGSAGVHNSGVSEQLPQVGNQGRGVASSRIAQGPTEKIPQVGNQGRGVHRAHVSEKLPSIARGAERGVPRPALQIPVLNAAKDAFCGEGTTLVNIREWMRALAERLRRVRVANGDFARVLTPAVTTGHGLTGVFIDPPYAEGADDLYAHHDKTVSARARIWALENGRDPLLRVVFCGYDGEHGADPFPGWREVRWKASGGYGISNGNEYRERIWLSPGCLKRGEPTGFVAAAEAG